MCSEFELLQALVVGVLACDENEAMRILSLRLSADDFDAETASHLAEVDEAVELLDVYDTREVAEEQKSAAVAKVARLDFSDAFAKKAEGNAPCEGEGQGQSEGQGCCGQAATARSHRADGGAAMDPRGIIHLALADKRRVVRSRAAAATHL